MKYQITSAVLAAILGTLIVNAAYSLYSCESQFGATCSIKVLPNNAFIVMRPQG
jgi:hypothetical protein